MSYTCCVYQKKESSFGVLMRAQYLIKKINSFIVGKSRLLAIKYCVKFEEKLSRYKRFTKDFY